MAEKSLVQKLYIKPGMRGAVIGAPAGFREQLGELPEGAQLDTALDGFYQFLLLFVDNRAAVESWWPKLLEAAQPGVMLWIAYPKMSGGKKTDINRDAGWEPVQQSGWDGVAQVAIDDTWSALRFRPVEEIRRTGGAEALNQTE